MAKYDWAKLKREYMLGDYKSLRAFAEDKGVPYNGFFKKKTIGWSDEKRLQRDQKETKITEKVTEQEIKHEVDRNAAHLAVGDKILNKLSAMLNMECGAQSLQAAANTLEKIQRIHQLGESAGKGKDDLADDALSAALKERAKELDNAT